MAFQRKLFESHAPQPFLVTVAGKVAIGGTGAVGTQSGKGFKVTRTDVGLYTITFDTNGSAVPAVLYCAASIVFATGSNTQQCYVLTHAASSATVTLQCVDSGTADTAADPPSGSYLQIFAVVQNSQSTG